MRRVAVIALLLACAAVAVVALRAVDDGNYELRVEFATANGLRVNSDVKISGVPAGSVKEIELGGDDRAIVTVELDDRATPVTRTARAAIRPVNLLGEKYLELDPGASRGTLPSGATIPRRRTRIPVELDEVLNSIDISVRARLRMIINEFGIAATGRGVDFARTLESLPPALDEARELLESVAASNSQLESAIRSGRRVIGRASEKRQDLGRLVDNAAGALETVAQRRAQLGQTVASAPAFLREARTTLGRLGAAATDLRPTARRLTATTKPLVSTLEALPEFRDDARATLQTATRVAPSLDRLARRGTPLVRRLRPTVQGLATFAGQLDPVLTELDEGAGLKSVLHFMATWGAVTQHRDGLGHVFRVRPMFSETLVESMVDHAIGAGKRGASGGRGDAGRPRSDQVRGDRPAVDPAGGAPASQGPRDGEDARDSVRSPDSPSTQLGDVVEQLLPGARDGQRQQPPPSPTRAPTGLLDLLLGAS